MMILHGYQESQVWRSHHDLVAQVTEQTKLKHNQIGKINKLPEQGSSLYICTTYIRKKKKEEKRLKKREENFLE